MTRRLARLLFCLLVATPAAACDGGGAVGPDALGRQDDVGSDIGSGADLIVGSGEVITVRRELPVFDSVLLAGEGNVLVTVGTAQAVSIRSDDNLVPLITTEVSGGVLTIGTADSVTDLDPTAGVLVMINMPSLVAIDIAGAGTIAIDGMAASELSVGMSGVGTIVLTDVALGRLTVEAAGVGSIEVSGTANSQQVTLEGVVTYQAADLLTETAEVRTDSLDEAVLRVTDTLNVAAASTGEVRYYGDPEATGPGVRLEEE